MQSDAPTKARSVFASYRSQRIREGLRLRNAGVVYAFLILVGVLTVLTTATGQASYLSSTNIANILDQTAQIGILAVFMTVVLISGNFDLSVGSVAAMSAAVILLLIDEQGLIVAGLAALGAGLAVGSFNGFIVQFIGINAFIVTLGTLTAIRGVVLILTDARTVEVQSAEGDAALRAIESGLWTTPNLLLLFGLIAALAGGVFLWRRWSHRGREGVTDWRAWGALLIGVALLLTSAFIDVRWTFTKSVYYMLAITLVTWAVLRFTVIGRRLYAVGGNAEAARLSGIRVNRYKVGAFMLNGLAAGVVGILFAAKLGAVNPTAFTGAELTVLAAAILGGTSLFGGSGSVFKSLIGALILFTLANGFNLLNLGATYQGLIEGMVIIIAAAVYTLASQKRQKAEPEPTAEAAGESAKPEERGR
jgi:ribose/xylose/arabinose/galactoside ABC-type transport system permease subunit